MAHVCASGEGHSRAAVASGKPKGPRAKAKRPN